MSTPLFWHYGFYANICFNSMKKKNALIFLLVGLKLMMTAQAVAIDSIDIAINNASNHFNLKGVSISNPDVIYKLNHYQLHYGLPTKLPDYNSFKELSNGNIAFFDLLSKDKLFTNLTITAEEFENLSHYNKLLRNEAYSALCTRTILPVDYSTDLYNYAQPGGYYLYYSMLQFYQVQQQHCIPSDEYNNRLWKKMLNDLIIQHEYPDLIGCTEGLNFNFTTYVLLHTKNSSYVDATNIRKIISNQLANGSWSMTSDEASDDLATLYGLLSLYEYKLLNGK